MASVASCPLRGIWPMGKEGTLVANENDPCYSSKSDTSRYEVHEIVFLGQEASLTQDGSFSMLVQIENNLRYFHMLGVNIINPSDIREYLYNYPDMIKVLEFVVDLAVQRFDHDSELSLEVYHDQETQYERLTLYVRLHKYDKNLMKIIEQIREEYRNSFSEARGRFLLTTDFRFAR
jgi:hypothetical protein